MLLALVWYVLYAHKFYKGPINNLDDHSHAAKARGEYVGSHDGYDGYMKR